MARMKMKCKCGANAVVELEEKLFCWGCYPGIRDAVRKDKLHEEDKNRVIGRVRRPPKTISV